MSAASLHHLTLLDRTLVSLLNERARLVAQDPEIQDSGDAHVNDLLRRSAGPFPAEELRATFTAIREGCRGADR